MRRDPARPAAGQLVPIARHALGDEVYRALRGMIVRGALEPGSRITETRISELLGVSRTPVREAFQRLEFDGLLAMQPGRSARVTVLTSSDIEAIYPVIGVLEGLAARLAGPHLSEEDLKHMMRLTDEMERCGRLGQIDALLEADNAFHGVLHARASNRHLQRVVRDLRDQMDRFEYAFFSDPAQLRASISRHRKLVRILRSGNLERAERTLIKQWDLGRQGLLEIVGPGNLSAALRSRRQEGRTDSSQTIRAGAPESILVRRVR